MQDNYENLGFQVNVEGADSAVARLDNIISRLEGIRQLEGKNNNIIAQKKEVVIKKTEEQNKSLAKTISLYGYIPKVVKYSAKFLQQSVKESANYIENLNLFAVAYRDTYRQQIDWALGLADAYGLANNEVLKFAGTFRELASSLGIVEDTADTVSKVVTQLGYDLSALFNTSVTDAMERLQSGVFSGNVRPLRAFGIDISQGQIDELFRTNEELAKLGVNARNLSQSDKAIARLIITLQSANDSYGTMAREINNLQSQFRIFEGSISNLKLAFGDLIEGPLTEIMVFVNAAIIALTDIIRAIVPLNKEDKTPFTNYAEDAEKTNQEVEKLEKKLAGFDKFNVLQDSKDSSSGTTTEELNKLLQEQANIYDEQLSKSLEEMKNKAKDLAGEIKPLISILITLGASFVPTLILTGFERLNFSFDKYKGRIEQLRLDNALATTSFQKLQVAINSVVSGITSMAFGITSLISNWKDMTPLSRALTIIISLAAAIGAAAAALYLFKQNWAMAIGVGATVLGTGLTIGSQLGTLSAHANGGYTNANLIMTHENGKREWVGKAAGSSAIVNDTQMSDIMEVAVAKGVYRALSTDRAYGNATTDRPIVIKIGEEQVFRAVQTAAKRQGKGFANI